MDNQQETLMINDNYIAGLLDSDFGVYITKNTYKGKVQYTPRIKFINTRLGLVDVCSAYLLSKNINHYVSINKATVGKDSKYLVIQRLTKCLDFSETYKALSVGRSKQLELISSFCTSRLSKITKNKYTSYTNNEHSLYEELRDLNYNYNVDFGNRNYTYSWLAGLIDGDGSIFISTTKRGCKYKNISGVIKNYTYTKYLPVIKITTESTAVYNNVIEIYNKIGVKFYTEETKSKVSNKLGKNLNKILYNIKVTSFDSVTNVLQKLGDKLQAKNLQAEYLLDFINEKRCNKHNTPVIKNIVEKVQDLNKNY